MSWQQSPKLGIIRGILPLFLLFYGSGVPIPNGFPCHFPLVPNMSPSSPIHQHNRPWMVLALYRAPSSNTLTSWHQGFISCTEWVLKRPCAVTETSNWPNASPLDAEGTAYCFASQFLFSTASSPLHLKVLLHCNSTFVDVHWQKVFGNYDTWFLSCFIKVLVSSVGFISKYTCTLNCLQYLQSQVNVLRAQIWQQRKCKKENIYIQL